jgi:hypothetical protein
MNADTARLKSTPKNRQDWAAWRVDEREVRVQVNRSDIAKAFAKVKTVRPVGYSVCGDYTRLFHVKQPVPWVDEWMNNYVKSINNAN